MAAMDVYLQCYLAANFLLTTCHKDLYVFNLIQELVNCLLRKNSAQHYITTCLSSFTKGNEAYSK